MPDREQGEGDERPAPALDLPAVPDPSRGEHADGEGEGHGEADEAGVEERRVDGNQRVVLEQRVGPEPGGDPRRGDEGVGRPEHEPEEERGDDVEDEESPPDHGVGRQPPVAPDERRGEEGEEQAPQQDGAGQGGPQPGHRVEQRRGPAVVLGHEDREKSCVTSACSMASVARSAPARRTGASRPAVAGSAGAGGGAGPARPARASHQADRDDDDPGDAGAEGQPDADRPDVRVDHQRTAPEAGLTRPGCCAM